MKERRRSARLVEAVAFRIAYEGFDITAETLNLSSNGLLCRVKKPIPLMTQTEIILLLPQRSKRGQERQIRAKGVVVRAEKEDEMDRYRLAIFFTEMSKSNKELFETYIRERLNKR